MKSFSVLGIVIVGSLIFVSCSNKVVVQSADRATTANADAKKFPDRNLAQVAAYNPFYGNLGSYEKPVLNEEYELPIESPSCKGWCLSKANVKTEPELFTAQAKRIQELQTFIKEKRNAAVLKRGFHAKSRGCLVGKLDVEKKIVFPEAFLKLQDTIPALREITPDTMRIGIYDSSDPFYVLARFSNGVGWDQEDSETEVRGLAVKVLGHLDGSPISKSQPEVRTQDLISTNFPRPVGDNSIQFMDFAEHAVKGKLSILAFLTTSSSPAKAVVGDIVKGNGNLESLVTETYFGGSPYRLGKWATKFNFIPHVKKGKGKKRDGEFFIQDVAKRALEAPIKFDLVLQFQTDPIKTPVEHNLVEWTEAQSPSIKVATLTLYKQEVGQKAEDPRRAFCDSLFFTPWNNLPEQVPMGNINRARGPVYLASAGNSSRANAGSSSDTRLDSRMSGYNPAPEPTVDQVKKIYDPNGILE